MADKGEGEKSKVGANVCKISSARLLNLGGRKEEKWTLCIGESVLSLEGETEKRGGELFCLSIVAFLLGPFISQLASRLVLPSLWSLQRDLATLEGGTPRKFLGSLVDTMVINTLEKLGFISNTLSTRVQTLDGYCANVWQKYGLSLLLGISVAFWYCKQLTQPQRSSVSEIVYTKEFHLSVCLQFTCEWAKPSQ